MYSGIAPPSLRLQRAHSYLVTCSHRGALSTCRWGICHYSLLPGNKERAELRICLWFFSCWFKCHHNLGWRFDPHQFVSSSFRWILDASPRENSGLTVADSIIIHISKTILFYNVLMKMGCKLWRLLSYPRWPAEGAGLHQGKVKVKMLRDTMWPWLQNSRLTSLSHLHLVPSLLPPRPRLCPSFSHF